MIRNLRIYLKFLAKNKLYTFVSVFGFSVSLMFVIILGLYVKQELSIDNFHVNKDRIYLIANDKGINFGNLVPQMVQDNCPEVESFTRVMSRDVSIGKKGKEKFTASGLYADPAFFQIFSFKLLEGDPKSVLVPLKSVVVTTKLANQLFGNESPMGKHMTVDNEDYLITGVMEEMPVNSQFPQADFIGTYSSITQFWGGNDWVLTTNNNFGFSAYFLEKKGADLSTKIPTLLTLFKEELWYYKHGFAEDLKFIPLEEVYFNLSTPGGYFSIKRNSRTLISVYLAIVFLILAIAVLNYVNMTVAQSGFRGKESAIKKLLGGDRKSIIIQLLGESFCMSVLAFGLGLFFAFLVEPFFNNVLNTQLDLASQFTPGIILFVLFFILLLTFVSGTIPALVISGFDPLEVVKGGLAKKVKTSYSKGLIVFQYTVAIVLLIVSVFLKQQSEYLINHELGYNKDRILVMNNVLESTQLEGFRSKLLTIPGVEMVSFSAGTPMSGGNNNSYEIDGEQYSFQELVVDSFFYKMYGVTIEPTGVPMSEETYFVNRYAFNAPITNRQDFTINFGWEGRELIAGIINDMHFRDLSQNIQYIRLKESNDYSRVWNISVKIAESADLFGVADQVKKVYSDYNGGELTKTEFVTDTIQQWYEREQKLSSILTAFTLLTILIAIMGVFAMSLYLVKQKEKEIGVRKVNGATEGQILWMLNKASLIRVLIAFLIACPIAYYAVSKWLEGFTYKIGITLWPFLLAGVVIALLTLISVSYLTWRAARANPVTTLKSE